MSKVQSVDLKYPPNEAVIRSLTKAMEEAKNGELQGFVMAGVNQRGEVITCISGARQVFQQIGVMEAIKMMVLLQDAESIREEIDRISIEGP